MPLFRKRPGRAGHDRGEKKPPSFADQCERVCTGQGRKAHYRHPDLGILCGWQSPDWIPAGPGCPDCKLCRSAAEAADEMRPAS